MRSPLFYAKILLFGEYGIIENSEGLTIPYNFYKGMLKFDTEGKHSHSQSSLKNFCNYLKSLTLPEPYTLNIQAFENDLAKGLYFDSDIPQGYGVGSSGALVAAIFDRYSKKKLVPEKISRSELLQLKEVLGKMESFFHGTSSGIDPLICFMNIPLHIKSKQDISTIGLPDGCNGNGAIFLINSGIPGNTEPMVKVFFEKLKHEGFRKTLRDEFIHYNNSCIQAFIKKEFGNMFHHLKKLSSWALEHLQPMIPKHILDIWEKGLETNLYYLKLCGSGGGGFILGFTEDFEKTKKELADFDIEVIYRF